MKYRLISAVLFVLIVSSVPRFAISELAYILVQSELNVRSRPSLGSTVFGRLFTGDSVQVTKKYREWLFLEGLPSEEGHGWVSSSYVVSDPVTQMDGEPAIIDANGRVAVRNSVDGKRIAWVYPGDIVHVYGISDSWTVTDRGYIKTEFLNLKTD